MQPRQNYTSRRSGSPSGPATTSNSVFPGTARDWATEDAGHDSRHDCLIWARAEPQSHLS